MTTFTDEQILNLDGVRQRQDTFQFRLIDSFRNPLGSLDISADNAPSIQFDGTRATARTMSNATIHNRPSDLNLFRDRVLVNMVLQNGSVYPLGVFMFGQDMTTKFNLDDEWTPDLFDESFLLDTPMTESTTLKVGDSLLDFFTARASAVLDPLGIPYDYSVPDALSSGLQTFVKGDSLLTGCLQSVASALGCFPPYFDNNGVHRLKGSPPFIVNTDHIYDAGTRVFPGPQLTNSLYKAANQFIVIGGSLDTGGITGIYDLPSSAPNSAAASGRIIPSIHKVPAIATVELANLQAYVDALTDRNAYGSTTFTAAADPTHDGFDGFALFGDLYMETGWEMTLQSGGDHTHHGNRVWL